MDIDIMSRQLQDLTRRVEALEGHPGLSHNPEGVVDVEAKAHEIVARMEADAHEIVARMEADAMTEDRVKALIAEHNQTARGAEPGGVVTGDAGKIGMSSQGTAPVVEDEKHARAFGGLRPLNTREEADIRGRVDPAVKK